MLGQRLLVEINPVLERRHNFGVRFPSLEAVTLVHAIRRSLAIIDLVVEYEKQRVSSRIVVGSDVRVLSDSFLHDLAHNLGSEILVVLSLEDLVLSKSLLDGHLLVNLLRLNQSLQLLELKSALSILDGQCAKRIELRVFKISEPLRLLGIRWHHVTVLAWKGKVTGGLLLTL